VTWVAARVAASQVKLAEQKHEALLEAEKKSNQNRSLRINVEELREEVATLTVSRDHFMTLAATKGRELDRMRKENEAIFQQLDQAREAMAAMRSANHVEELDQASKTNEALMGKLDEAHEECNALETQLEQAKEEAAAATAAAEAARQKLRDEHSKKVEVLEAKLTDVRREYAAESARLVGKVNELSESKEAQLAHVRAALTEEHALYDALNVKCHQQVVAAKVDRPHVSNHVSGRGWWPAPYVPAAAAAARDGAAGWWAFVRVRLLVAAQRRERVPLESRVGA
jgi:hypothetical protein